MQRVTRYTTDDGNCFNTEREARKHLEIKYGNQLTTIAHRLIQYAGSGKYTAICEFLDANLHLFKKLIELKCECNATIEDDND